MKLFAGSKAKKILIEKVLFSLVFMIILSIGFGHIMYNINNGYFSQIDAPLEKVLMLILSIVSGSYLGLKLGLYLQNKLKGVKNTTVREGIFIMPITLSGILLTVWFLQDVFNSPISYLTIPLGLLLILIIISGIIFGLKLSEIYYSDEDESNNV